MAEHEIYVWIQTLSRDKCTCLAVHETGGEASFTQQHHYGRVGGVGRCEIVHKKGKSMMLAYGGQEPHPSEAI